MRPCFPETGTAARTLFGPYLLWPKCHPTRELMSCCNLPMLYATAIGETKKALQWRSTLFEHSYISFWSKQCLDDVTEVFFVWSRCIIWIQLQHGSVATSYCVTEDRKWCLNSGERLPETNTEWVNGWSYSRWSPTKMRSSASTVHSCPQWTKPSLKYVNSKGRM